MRMQPFRNNRWVTAALACALLLGTSRAQGQQPANLKSVVIRVTDQSGAAVPGAQVRAAPVPEKMPEKMWTDSKGEFALQLEPGGHALMVRLAGFTVFFTHIDVKTSEETQFVPIVLKIASFGGPTIVGLSTPETDVLRLSVYPFQETFPLKLEDLRAMPRKTAKVHDPHTKADEEYGGVALSDLLGKYGAPLGKELHGSALAYYIVATGSDGYQAVLSLGEVDPSFHPGEVLVADTMDGKPLDAHNGPFKLVVTEDNRPARAVRNLVALQLKLAQ